MPNFMPIRESNAEVNGYFAVFFQDVGCPPSWIFKSYMVLRVNICVYVPNFMAISHTFAEIWRFIDFSKWLCPLSWICYRHVGTIRKEHLLFSIIVQNLVGIDAVVLSFNILHVWL